MKKYLKEMNFLKVEKDITDKGITLIALVVTIVVLLILASVSITVVFGDNGLIEMAREAGRKTNEAVEKEQGDIANLTNDIKDYVNGTSRGKTLVQMFKDGELKVGDYISYENPTEGSYTAEAERTGMDRAGVEGITSQTFSVANNPLHWRVLGIDKETGGLKLIAGRPIKSDRVNTDNDPYFYMYGANAYEYGKEELDNIAGIFMNEKYAEKVRSVTIDDINEAVGIETEEDIKKVNYYEHGGEKQYGESYSFTNHYTPSSWLNGKNQTTVSGKVSGYTYIINSDEVPSVEVKDETLFNLLFDNVYSFKGDSGNGACYWTASGGEWESYESVMFGLFSIDGYDDSDLGVSCGGSFSSDDPGEQAYAKGVRPVVILKSNLTIDKLEKEEPVTEETWNYETSLGAG